MTVCLLCGRRVRVRKPRGSVVICKRHEPTAGRPELVEEPHDGEPACYAISVPTAWYEQAWIRLELPDGIANVRHRMEMVRWAHDAALAELWRTGKFPSHVSLKVRHFTPTAKTRLGTGRSL